MKYLIVGIGNKGEEYVETRHNIGFKVAEKVAETIDAPFKSSNFGLLAEGKYKGRKAIFSEDDSRLLHAFDLYLEGLSDKDVAKLTGINERTFRRYREKHKIKR